LEQGRGGSIVNVSTIEAFRAIPTRAVYSAFKAAITGLTRSLAVGCEVSRLSTIKDVAMKEGRSGPLVFVTVRHEVSDAQGLVLTDEHDIVYRGEDALKGKDTPAPSGERWCREIHPDPVLLFRYSAVTFNSHRIHYDHPYATRVEGYPGLVVHGPLIATLLVDLLRRNVPEATLRTFSFRALKPLFDTADFSTCGLPDGRAAPPASGHETRRSHHDDATHMDYSPLASRLVKQPCSSPGRLPGRKSSPRSGRTRSSTEAPECFVWVALKDPEPEELEEMLLIRPSRARGRGRAPRPPAPQDRGVR
jgi:hypothetical protein